jgi:outer membrane receptor protein involved in Fe transport
VVIERTWAKTVKVAAIFLLLAGSNRSFAESSEKSGQSAPDGGTQAPSADVPEVVVTAVRIPRPIRDVPAAVTVLPRKEIEHSPTETLDELLRMVPSFATFRRSSSLVSDPTAQGVNLRGVGPSGVSRTLVLVDGIPANDPFGGWFYWRAIPRLGVDRVEVVPGGSSALYGNYALGGVIQVFSRPILGTAIDADVQGGYPGQLWTAARAAERSGSAAGSIEGEFFSTAGYPVLAPNFRGPIDRSAPSKHGTVNARLEIEAMPELKFFGAGGYFWEEQNGGTAFTTSLVRSGSYSGGVALTTAQLGTLGLSVFGHAQSFQQERGRAGADRVREDLAATQNVPTDDQGAALVWTSKPFSLGGTHLATAGLDVRRIHGVSKEDLHPVTVSSSSILRREAGGEQRFAGLFIQDVYELSPALMLVGALRFDGWKNLNASQLTENGAQVQSTIAFAERTDRQLTPKLGARLRPADWITFRASAYRAFRAPTLNELYRPFQVGTVLTAANPNLTAETLQGAELGLTLSSTSAWTARATAFWNDLDQPIANLTLPVPLPDGSQRQRQNIGRARIRGIEFDAVWRFARAWSATVAYTLVDSAVTQSGDNPQLIGKQLPQDPAHRAGLAITFDDPGLLTVTVQSRFVGPQFEDDLNQLPMAGFFILDVAASRRLFSNLAIFAAIENLLDRQYLVGRAGLDTVGQPFTVRAGLRWRAGP